MIKTAKKSGKKMVRAWLCNDGLGAIAMETGGDYGPQLQIHYESDSFWFGSDDVKQATVIRDFLSRYIDASAAYVLAREAVEGR